MSDSLRIMIAAGGTGGHVFPAIAIADAIRGERPDAQFLFVGTRDRMEWKAVPAAGYDIAPIWISGLHRRLTLKNLLFPVKLLISLWQSRAWCADSVRMPSSVAADLWPVRLDGSPPARASRCSCRSRTVSPA